MNTGRLWVRPYLYKETAGGPVVEHVCLGCGEVALATPTEAEPMCGACLRARSGAATTVQKQRRRHLSQGPGVTGLTDRSGRKEITPVAPEPWPEPVVPATPIDFRRFPEQLPRAAAGMARLADQHGWEIRVTYARGTLQLDTLVEVGLHEDGKIKKERVGPPQIVDSIAVRMRRGDQYVVAIWLDGKFRGGWRDPWRRLGAKDVKGVIRGDRSSSIPA